MRLFGAGDLTSWRPTRGPGSSQSEGSEQAPTETGTRRRTGFSSGATRPATSTTTGPLATPTPMGPEQLPGRRLWRCRGRRRRLQVVRGHDEQRDRRNVRKDLYGHEHDGDEDNRELRIREPHIPDFGDCLRWDDSSVLHRRSECRPIPTTSHLTVGGCSTGASTSTRTWPQRRRWTVDWMRYYGIR